MEEYKRLTCPQNGIVTVTPEDAKKIFYHDIPSEEGDKWASKLTHQSLGTRIHRFADRWSNLNRFLHR